MIRNVLNYNFTKKISSLPFSENRSFNNPVKKYDIFRSVQITILLENYYEKLRIFFL